VDGTGLERITYNDTFDGFPMFSPNGKKLVFASNRTAKYRARRISLLRIGLSDFSFSRWRRAGLRAYDEQSVLLIIFSTRVARVFKDIAIK